MISFYLLWTGCYVGLLSLFLRKWPKSNPEVNYLGNRLSVTLVIPFRNELENLPNLAAELQKVDFPNLEILLIDDQSEDGSFDFLEEMLKSDLRIKILKSPGIGKKKAIAFGIEAAKNKIILCSDADCQFPKDWVAQLVRPFSDPAIQLVAGPVISKGGAGFFRRFQQIDWASILLMTWYFFTQKKPLMCSGANLAYRKAAFEAVDGFQNNLHHLSGDDEFLLKKISGHFGKQSCIYLPYPGALVYTNPQKSIPALLNQRIRWAGKWKVHRDPVHAISAAISFLIQIVWLGSLVLLSWGIWGILVFIAVWLGKITTEKLVLGKVLRAFGIHLSFVDFLKTGMVHPIYVLMVAFGTIRGKFIWKGRSN